VNPSGLSLKNHDNLLNHKNLRQSYYPIIKGKFCLQSVKGCTTLGEVVNCNSLSEHKVKNADFEDKEDSKDEEE
jgi:hypothetical protein